MRTAGVFPQSPGRVQGLADDLDLPFPLLIDEDRAVIRAYGVYVRVNFESWNMARPSVFLIDPQGRVQFLHVGSHQRDWPDSEALWAVVDGDDAAGSASA